MRLWTYQHPSVLQTLERGERHVCRWDWVAGDRWQNAFRVMKQQMALRSIDTGEHAPVWAWHSVNRPGGKPDQDCAMALMSDIQLAQGIDLLELEVPDQQVLVSDYGYWNTILDGIVDGNEPAEHNIAACFDVQLAPRRGRPPHYFPSIQACLASIEPDWLSGWEILDTKKIMQDKQVLMAEYLEMQKKQA
jgi:hypothetical protein